MSKNTYSIGDPSAWLVWDGGLVAARSEDALLDDIRRSLPQECSIETHNHPPIWTDGTGEIFTGRPGKSGFYDSRGRLAQSGDISTIHFPPSHWRRVYHPDHPHVNMDQWPTPLISAPAADRAYVPPPRVPHQGLKTFMTVLMFLAVLMVIFAVLYFAAWGIFALLMG
jgi:hypothetical protein